MTLNAPRRVALPVALAMTLSLSVSPLAASPDMTTGLVPIDPSQPQVRQAQFIEDIGASQRIDLSGKLRMLSQRVTAAACYVHMGVSADEATTLLSGAQAEFDLILDALENGNDDLGVIGMESNARLRIILSRLTEQWEPLSGLAQQVVAGSGNATMVAEMAGATAPVLEAAQLNVSEMTARYADPMALLQADALAIDIAGRQRMLAQRMSKNVCLIAAGIETEAARAELQGASDMFDTSLMALRNGLPDAGIQPPPNAEIAAQLDTVIAIWNEARGIVDRVLAGEALGADDLTLMYQGGNALTGNMNTAVGLYSDASKLNL